MADVVDYVHFYATMMNVLSLCTSAGGIWDEEVMIFFWFQMMTPKKHKETEKKQKHTTLMNIPTIPVCTSPGGFWKLKARKEFGAVSWFEITTPNKHEQIILMSAPRPPLYLCTTAGGISELGSDKEVHLVFLVWDATEVSNPQFSNHTTAKRKFTSLQTSNNRLES